MSLEQSDGTDQPNVPDDCLHLADIANGSVGRRCVGSLQPIDRKARSARLQAGTGGPVEHSNQSGTNHRRASLRRSKGALRKRPERRECPPSPAASDPRMGHRRRRTRREGGVGLLPPAAVTRRNSANKKLSQNWQRLSCSSAVSPIAQRGLTSVQAEPGCAIGGGR